MSKKIDYSLEGRACTNCGDFKEWVEFGKRGEKKSTQCKKCVNLKQRKRWRAKRAIISAPGFPLEVNLRKARWVCSIHADIPRNHYLNYRGHRVCKPCHFKSIVKANRDRRRRENPEWRRIDRRKIHRQKLRDKRNEGNAAEHDKAT